MQCYAMLCYGMLSRYRLALALEELMQRQEVRRFLPGTHLQGEDTMAHPTALGKERQNVIRIPSDAERSLRSLLAPSARH